MRDCTLLRFNALSILEWCGRWGKPSRRLTVEDCACYTFSWKCPIYWLTQGHTIMTGGQLISTGMSWHQRIALQDMCSQPRHDCTLLYGNDIENAELYNGNVHLKPNKKK